MALKPGTQLGPYEITAPLGAGGMGEVYRARDTKLGREVAIKVLPEELSRNRERRERFEREAKLLASLNHPAIATLYGFEDGFLVMELVEGETLAERIARRPIPLDDALPLFLQIAEGLEAAHEKGILHRDLKPANVMVTPAGKVKILDFGLAKAFDADGGVSAAEASQSPTLTKDTALGVILGTASYMSPEQARGLAVDRRTDVWAFGACLFEALAGSRAFTGESSPEILAKVLERTPDWGLLPSPLPTSVRRLLSRSLEKDSTNRLRHIGDAHLELRAAQEELADRDSYGAQSESRKWSWGIPVTLAIGLIVGGGAVWLLSGSDSGDAAVVRRNQIRSSIELLEDMPLASTRDMPYAVSAVTLAISPDGKQVVYVAIKDGVRRLVLRELDAFEHRVLPGTEDASGPFFSPDGEWLAFFTRDKLMRVPLQGGLPIAVCEAATANGGVWSDDGWIYFVHHEVKLARVEEDGGTPRNLTGGVSSFPSVLPNGRGVLVSVLKGWKSISHDSSDVVHVAPDGELRVLASGGYSPSYVPSGHLVFMRRGELMAAPFDLEELLLVDRPVKVLDGVATDSIAGVAQYSFSREGTLAFIEGGDWAHTVPSWVDRSGKVEPLLQAQAAAYGQLTLSPDRSKVAIGVVDTEDDIYVYDLRRDTFERLTLEGGDTFPVWTADGREVIFGSTRDGRNHATLFRKAVAGSGSAEALLSQVELGETEVLDFLPTSVSPDGRFLLFVGHHPKRALDVMLLPLDGGPPQPFVATEHSEVNGVFSPDGRWVVFLSDETGRHEVYVRPFPSGDAEWQISSGGGDDPRWSPDGSELFYRNGSDLMSVRYTSEGEFQPESPRLILTTDFYNVPGLSFDTSVDGERFLLNRPVNAGQAVRHIRLVSNWFDELERLVPTD